MAKHPATRPLSLIMASALVAACAADEPPPPATGTAPDLVEKALEVPRLCRFPRGRRRHGMGHQ